LKAKISICATADCSYVADMNWQQLLVLGVVLAVAAVFIWRGSDPRKHKHGPGCGCDHAPEDEGKKS
jgi:hypothetical protein